MRIDRGTVLKDRYKVIDDLATRQVTSLYLALDQRTNSPVVVKAIDRKADPKGQFVTRFQREAKILNDLRDPRIVRILDFGVQEEMLFIVTEFVPGKTLEKDLRERGTMDEVEALRIIRQVVEALVSTGQRGIVHRDIKPENIMVTASGEVKVLDFGVAYYLDATRITTGSSLSTVAYMSPEQTESSRVDIRSDIYSTGAVLYEMLTGHTPFEGDNIGQMVLQITTESPVPLNRYRPDVLPEVQNLVHRCLKKDPAERFPTPRELLRAIEGVGIDRYSDRLALMFAQAQEAFSSQDWARVVELGEKILKQNSHYPNVQDLLVRARRRREEEQRKNLDRFYAQATAAYERRNFDRVIQLCDRILHVDGECKEARDLRTLARQGGSRTALLTEQGGRFEIQKDSIVLGRSDPNKGWYPDVDLSGEPRGRTVHRKHALLTRHGDRWLIKPGAKNRNPTFVNGESLPKGSSFPLSNGDVLGVGGVKLKLKIEQLEPSPSLRQDS